MEPSRFRIQDAADPWDSRARADSECGVRNSEFVLRSSFFGVRSSEFVLRSSFFGVRSSEFVLRSSFFGVRSSEWIPSQPLSEGRRAKMGRLEPMSSLAREDRPSASPIAADDTNGSLETPQRSRGAREVAEFLKNCYCNHPSLSV